MGLKRAALAPIAVVKLTDALARRENIVSELRSVWSSAPCRALEASNDRDAAVRAAAVAALATSTDDAGVRSRLEILAVKDDSAEVRSTAIRVLGQRRAKSLY